MNLTMSQFLNKEDFEREQFIQWLGSFPMHDDDLGPDNTVLIDLLPAGSDFGEASLRRLAEAILWRTDRVHQIEKNQNDAEVLSALMGLNDALDQYWNSAPRTDAGIKQICAQQQRCKAAILRRRTCALTPHHGGTP